MTDEASIGLTGVQEESPLRGHRKVPPIKYIIIGVVILLLLLTGVGLLLYFLGRSPKEETEPGRTRAKCVPSSSKLTSVGCDWMTSESATGVYTKSAVSADHPTCSRIGEDMLKLGGTAVEAAIAAAFCDGLHNPQSMGIGGGFFATLYNNVRKEAKFVNSREMAPNANVPNDDDTISQIGIPMELEGYLQMYKGQETPFLPWSKLVEPSLKICEEGGPIVSQLLETNFMKIGYRIAMTTHRMNPEFEQWYISNKTSKHYREGDRIPCGNFEKTLKAIMNFKDILDDKLKALIAEDLKDINSTIALTDLDKYKPTIVTVKPQVEISVHGEKWKVYSGGLNTGGIILGHLMTTLEQNRDGVCKGLRNMTLTTLHCQLEAMKFAAAVTTQQGESMTTAQIMDFNRKMTEKREIKDKAQPLEYYGAAGRAERSVGTAHISVLAENGDAASITSSINWYGGSLQRGKRTGIIFNNQLLDFTDGPNVAAAGKKPRSSMTPTVITDQRGRVRFVTGASGGSQIPSSIFQVIHRHLHANQDLTTATDKARFYQGLGETPGIAENFYDGETLDALEQQFGQDISASLEFISVVQSISVAEDDTITAVADRRKIGAPDGL